MNRNLSVILFLLAFASIAFSQQAQTSETKTKTEQVSSNLLEKVDLRFNLTGTPKPEDVGFDDRKGSWKLKYKLLLSDQKVVGDLIPKAYANCEQTAANYWKCAMKASKKLDKKFRKIALPVSSGSFERKPLSSETARAIVVPVNFTPELIRIFNDAAQSAANPVFLLQIKVKVSAKTSTKKKILYKNSATFQYPLKLVKSDGSFEFYNITAFGASVSIERRSDGGFIYTIYRN